jgi:hypothetical protein
MVIWKGRGTRPAKVGNGCERLIYFCDRQQFLPGSFDRCGRSERLVGDTDSPLRYRPRQIVDGRFDLIRGQRLKERG